MTTLKSMMRAAFLALIALLAAAPGNAVWAASYETSVSVPFELEVQGERVPAAVFHFTLQAGDQASAAYLPERAERSLEGSGKDTFGPIRYDKPGDYRYVVRQTGEAARYFTVDRTAYEVIVRVTNRADGGLDAAIYAIKSGTDEKPEKLRFINSYTKPAPPPVRSTDNVRTGDTGISLYLIAAAGAMLILAAHIRKKSN